MHETRGYAGKRRGWGKGRPRREYEVDCRGWLEVVVLTLHSFVHPPEPSIRLARYTRSFSSLLKLELTPEVLMHLSTAHTVHKDTYVVC